jgi:ribosomal protein S3AE
MAEPNEQAALKKGAKKGFFEVMAPLTATKISLYSGSPDELVGKVAKIDLTRSLKGKNFELKFKVFKNEKGLLEGEPISLWLAGSYVRRMMRTGIDYVEDSFVAECKERKVRVKPFLIARNKVSRAVRRELRNMTRKFIESYVKTRSAKESLVDITTNKLQKELFLKLKVIYPLSFCEIRAFEILSEKK